ncbi:hypothetical protein [Palleronia sp.]|uniref:hypothetical protein n=1 Tax=Palleronia sp. TaxID=1940284 RepID=UPI0035C7ED41
MTGAGGAAPGTAHLRRILLASIMLAAVVLVFIDSRLLAGFATALLVLYLVLARRQFGFGTWVPVLMALGGLVAALWQVVAPEVLWKAVDRMLFLSALIAMLGTLRSAAAIAPEVHRAGLFVTGQPASRRYLALTSGSHLFGVLINFGGLALLLDLAQRSMASDEAARLPPEAREARLRRMTLAVIRGFSLISLWSPFGFAINAVLIAVPDLSYMSFGPIGFAMSFVFIAIGWAFDRREGRRLRRLGLPRPSPPPRSWTGAVALVAHVLALGATVSLVHELAPLSFQQGLICAVPCYALLWAALSSRAMPGGPASGIGRASRATWGRLSDMGPEIGVFASAGFLPVVLLALIPVEALRDAIAVLGLGPVSLALGMSFSIFGLALVGVNPIVVASVLGAIAAQLGVLGLNDVAIALAIVGGWTAVIGLSPFITTLVICGAIIGRSPATIGLRWNGPYCVAILLVWALMLTTLMLNGLI